MTTRIKRGSPGKRAPSRARPRTAQRSRANAALARLPFTEAQLQKAATIGVLGVLALAAVITAQFMGLPGMVQEEMALAAGRAGFEVKKVEVRNVDKMNELKVYEIVLAQKDRSMPQVDLEELRRELTRFSWIADARISRQLPDTLIVDIVEREPLAVWEDRGKVMLVDAEGIALEPSPGQIDPKMLRIVGKSANARIGDLTSLLDAAPALTPQVKEAEWVGNRRWNLTFHTGEVLALPEGEDLSEAALINFARMDGVNRLLGKGVTYFDLRDPERAYLRKPRSPALPEGDAIASVAQ
ncbi:cell division protein FtsQ/DivIB [Blastomonas aquatica]|uniref:Cell division protein FtsQ n=1 Tax=Blastomonas aquatica TaxID=1510276 RepID=A0ABQ1ISR8_9SPHN|nr:cell division protein FtsQ/DivIB [Blastomonas aquatica]GGB50471.1 cell division protein FtsQ [Blastomonas aquatica]